MKYNLSQFLCLEAPGALAGSVLSHSFQLFHQRRQEEDSAVMAWMFVVLNPLVLAPVIPYPRLKQLCFTNFTQIMLLFLAPQKPFRLLLCA